MKRRLIPLALVIVAGCAGARLLALRSRHARPAGHAIRLGYVRAWLGHRIRWPLNCSGGVVPSPPCTTPSDGTSGYAWRPSTTSCVGSTAKGACGVVPTSPSFFSDARQCAVCSPPLTLGESAMWSRTLRFVSLAFLAGCASTTDGPDGYWRYVHDTHGPQDTQSDLAMCEIGWLSSGMAAELERQLAAPLEKNADGQATWSAIFGQRRLRERKRETEARHIRACMTALYYKLRWFDGEGVRAGLSLQALVTWGGR